MRNLANLPSPRQWQSKALSRWLDNGLHGVVRVATGGGKTSFALMAIDTIAARLRHVLILVPTTALVDQWFLALLEAGAFEEDIAVWPRRGTRIETFNLMVANTARSKAPTLFAEVDGLMLVVDECHRFGAEANAQALAVPAAYTLGLSATPERQFDDGFQRHIAPAVGDVIFEYGVEDALADRVLSQFELVNLHVELTEDEEREYSNLTRRIAREMSSGADGESLERLLRLRAGVAKRAQRRLPAALALLERYRGRRGLVFHEEISAIHALQKELEFRGFSSALYHSRMGAGLRRDNLRQFQLGSVDLLLTCRALDEGLDVPDADFALIVAGTSSTRQRIQRLGRVLRSSPDKELATVVTIYATEVEESRLREEIESLDSSVPVVWMQGR